VKIKQGRSGTEVKVTEGNGAGVWQSNNKTTMKTFD